VARGVHILYLVPCVNPREY